ncbi:hypothetical protein Ancab_011778 [Ancistrocladus abbreviatus]
MDSRSFKIAGCKAGHNSTGGMEDVRGGTSSDKSERAFKVQQNKRRIQMQSAQKGNQEGKGVEGQEE